MEQLTCLTIAEFKGQNARNFDIKIWGKLRKNIIPCRKKWLKELEKGVLVG